MNARHGIRAAGLLSLAGLVFVAGCGSSGGGTAEGPTVVVNIPSAPVGPGQSFQFVATVNGDSGVALLWSLPAGATAGVITPQGLYTAGATPGIYQVVAKTPTDPQGADTSQITIVADPTPAFVSFPDSIEALTSAQVLPFTVTGTAGDSVAWSIAGGTFSGGTPAHTGGSIQGSDSSAAYLVVTLEVTNGAGRSTTIKDSAKVLGSRITLPDQTYALAISSTNVIASMEWLNENVRFRSASTRGVLGNVSIASTPIHGVFSADGSKFFVDLQSSNQVGMITVATGAKTLVGIGHPPFNIARAESGTAVYVTTADGWLFKLSTTDLAKQDSVYIHAASNGLDARSGQLWVATLGAMVYKVDPSTFALLDSVNVGGEAQRVVLNSDASKLYIANQGSFQYQVVTTATKAVASTSVPNGGSPVGAALTPDGTEIWFGARDQGRIDRYNAATMSFLGSITLGGNVRDIAFSSDGHIVLVGNESRSVLIRR